MAEAIINHYVNCRYQAYSAGSIPTGQVHPKALETLAHHGIKPNTPRSKSLSEFKSQSIDVVITVCDQAANESCPIFSGQSLKLHWSIPDPAKVIGTNIEINAAFEDVYNQLKLRIEKELLL